jgi:hypothetical protein
MAELFGSEGKFAGESTPILLAPDRIRLDQLLGQSTNQQMKIRAREQ